MAPRPAPSAALRSVRLAPSGPSGPASLVFYVAVFVVLGGWVSALRTLADILRGVLQ